MRPKKIDQSLIIQASLALLEESNVKSFSIRKLADKLAVKGASLYWHVKNKDELLCLIADYLSQKVEYPNPRLSCEVQLKVLFSHFRDVLLTHKNSAYVFIETPPVHPNRVELISKVSELLVQFGLPEEKVFSAAWMLNNYVISFVTEEYRLEEVNDKPKESIDDLNLPFNLAKFNTQKEFDFGLEVILNGLKQECLK
ncbi:TetR/AcrR family transcriptional regulator C-terminal domain-containing protein [Halalkalibacterium halodurans]|jgi:AcrR family transcriptional regulator|uniref:TetR/AcrR family transcriptional regulator C-terminal domain-containing protein n=1 Tax=Halalkalibacterium halodurans TaxID=86665 RepID=UPI0010FDF92A|nr:TetR/AcrR family transcriptional regulator C-terminal domain-containing protein [Halalkalibacterium halodurans]MED4161445.1 TetR/AcrR family transcriptional regulator C-terminal domain-containing protein [Halalkalibacterium halodurans]